MESLVVPHPHFRLFVSSNFLMQSSRSAFSIEPAPVAGTFLMITSKAVQAAFFATSEAVEATVVNWSDMELGQAASVSCSAKNSMMTSASLQNIFQSKEKMLCMYCCDGEQNGNPM